MTGRRVRATGSTLAEGVGARLRVPVSMCGRDHRVQCNPHDTLSQHCFSRLPDDQALKTRRGRRAKEKAGSCFSPGASRRDWCCLYLDLSPTRPIGTDLQNEKTLAICHSGRKTHMHPMSIQLRL